MQEEKAEPGSVLRLWTKPNGTREFTQSYERMYEELEVVNRGVNMIVDDVLKLSQQLVLKVAYRGIVTGVKRGKVEELLNRTPNPFQDINSFKRNLITDYLLDGNIFIYYDGAHLYHLPADKMSVVADAKKVLLKSISFKKLIIK